jgi:Kef-type K+ transport system membrane component KefB
VSGPAEAVDLKTAGKSLLALLIVLAGFWFIDHFMDRAIQKNSLFGLGFLILSGLAAGRLCTMVGLPSLTGYLAAGLLSGPSFLTIIDNAQVDQLRLVNGLALALIAMHAGCEFTKDMLAKNFKSLFHSSWANIVIIGVGITVVLMLMQSQIEFLQGFEFNQMIAIAALFAAIAVSKSPAAVVAILGETKIKNILSEHALGIVVILDVVVLILFSMLLAFAKSTLTPGVGFSIESLGHLLGEVGASIAAGTFFGLFIIFYLWLIDKERLLFIVSISYGVTALCNYLHYDTMLVFVVAGFTVTNFSKQSKKMINSIESLSSVVMIAFFATAGASLHLSDLLGIWQLVLVIFLARVFLTWAAERVAHQCAGSDPNLKKYGFTPFVSQAGLSIGLAMIVYDRLPGVGAQLATLAISVVTLNEIFGPILFKWGLNQVEKNKSVGERG